MRNVKSGWLVIRLKDNGLATLRGSLRHSWLENLVLSRDASDVTRLQRCSPVTRAPFDADVAPGGGFDQRIAEVRVLAHGIVEACSPARLVREGPLGSLPSDEQSLIAAVVHQRYLDATNIASLVADMLVSADAFAQALAQFRLVWCEPANSRVESTETSFARVKDAAASLHLALGLLPDGIVLP